MDDHIIAPDPQRHVDELCTLLDNHWKHTKLSNRIREPHHDWETSRVGIHGGKIVSFWAVFDLTLRIGSAHIKTAGVDCVITHPALRQQGWMTQTGKAALRAMREHGYLVSLLNGANHHYARFGYVHTWPECDYRIELNPVEEDVLLQAFEPGHDDARCRLYNETHDTLTGTAVRPNYATPKWPGLFDGYGWQDAAGQTGGYVVGKPRRKAPMKQFLVVDAAGDPMDIVRATEALGVRCGATSALYHRLHHRSALAHYLRQKGCDRIDEHTPEGGFRACVLDTRSLIQELLPELTQRLAASALEDWQGQLDWHVDVDRFTLEIGQGRWALHAGGGSANTVRGGPHIAQLIFGTKDPTQLVEAGQIEATGKGLHLLRMLFPEQDPQIGAVDL